MKIKKKKFLVAKKIMLSLVVAVGINLLLLTLMMPETSLATPITYTASGQVGPDPNPSPPDVLGLVGSSFTVQAVVDTTATPSNNSSANNGDIWITHYLAPMTLTLTGTNNQTNDGVYNSLPGSEIELINAVNLQNWPDDQLRLYGNFSIGAHLVLLRVDFHFQSTTFLEGNPLLPPTFVQSDIASFVNTNLNYSPTGEDSTYLMAYNVTGTSDPPGAVPEPSTMLLLGSGLLGLIGLRRKFKA